MQYKQKNNGKRDENKLYFRDTETQQGLANTTLV